MVRKRKTTMLVTMAAMLGLFVTVLAGCGYKSGNEVGKYYFDHNGEEYNITLLEDGKVEFKVGDDELSGKYSLDGNQMKIKLEDKTEIKVTYEDEEMHLTYDDIEMSFVRAIEYNVSFESNGGSKVNDATVLNGRHLAEPKAPTRKQYAFVGWFKDEALTKPFNFAEEEIVSDIKLYAKWSYVDIVNTITYETDSIVSTANPTKSVVEGKEYTLEVPKLNEGKIFDGWYLEDGTRLTDNIGNGLAKWDPSLGDITVKAHYVEGLRYEAVGNDELKVSGSDVTINKSEIVIPAEYDNKKITQIGEFKGHSKLEVVTLPNTLKEFSESAFLESPKLREYKLSGEATNGFSVKDGVLFKDNGATLVAYPIAKEGRSYVVPNDVTRIANRAFSGIMIRDKYDLPKFFGELEEVTLPANLLSIGEFAFYQRVSLTKVLFAGEGTLPLEIGDFAFSIVPLHEFEIPKNTVRIGASAFATDIDFDKYLPTFNETLNLPEGLVEIGANAFETNKNIKAVTLPASLTKLGEGAFSKCSGIMEFTFAEGSRLEAIPANAFYKVQFEKLVLPSSIKTIGDSAFEDSFLTSLVIPEGVTEIGNRIFAECEYLESVTFPATLEKMGDDIFANCGSLSMDKVKFADDNTLVKIVDGVMYTYDMKGLLLYPRNKKDTTYVMPETVEYMSERAFYNNKSLKSITLSPNLKSISASAFYSTAFTEITIPASVTEISEWAFRMSKVETINFEENSSLKTIGKEAFYSGKLTTLVLPEGLERIANNAFQGCSKLTSITLPSTLISIGNFAFENTSMLKEFVVADGNKAYKSVDGVLYSEDGSVLVCYPAKKAGTEFTLPETVTEIASSAFYKTALTKITVTPNLKKIDDKAFYNSKLIEIDLKDVLEIGNRSFYNSKLAKVDLTNAIKLDNEAFYGNKTCTELIIGKGLRELPKGVFQSMGITELTVPGNIEVIGELAFSGTQITKLVLEEGVVDLRQRAFSNTPLLAEVKLSNSLRYIDDNAFDNSASKESALRVLEIPANVEYIGEDILLFNQLEEIKVSADNKNYKSVDGNLFTKDGKVLKVYAAANTRAEYTVPDGVVEISNHAFYNVEGLAKVNIPATVERIGFMAFTYCYDLKDINVSEDNKLYKSIDGSLYSKDGKIFYQYAFGRTETELVLPESVEEISDYAFYNDFGPKQAALTKITFGSKVAKRGFNCFAGFKSIKEMVINSQGMIDYIQDGDFDQVTPLNYVKTLRIKEGLEVNSYITDSFTKGATENGYIIYTR